MNMKLAWWKMTKKSVEKSVIINIERISNEKKAKEYKAEVEAQTKIDELNMQHTNAKWDAMMNRCLNAAKKVLEEKPKSNNNRYENEEIAKSTEKQKKMRGQIDSTRNKKLKAKKRKEQLRSWLKSKN